MSLYSDYNSRAFSVGKIPATCTVTDVKKDSEDDQEMRS